jgi:hypothetical protein
MPELSTSARHRVVVLSLPTVLPLELGIAKDTVAAARAQANLAAKLGKTIPPAVAKNRQGDTDAP